MRKACLHVHESWLAAKSAEIGVVPGSGFAVVATGSLGRRELLPYSDLDLLLVHDELPAEAVRRTAEMLWYPLWDAHVRLDHSVRTTAEALQAAGSDILAGLAMLDARHIAGDQRLSARLIAGIRQQWRRGIRSRYGELVETTHSRWQRSGEIAQRADPDLKCGRGGLRDVHLLHALAIADRTTAHRPDGDPGSLLGAYRTVLDVRTELHRASGRGENLLLARYTDQISGALGMGDSYDLAARLFDAACTISRRVDAALQAVADASTGHGRPRVRV